MFTIINGRWSHLNGEPLNPIESYQLSRKIDEFKPIAKITPKHKLTTVFQFINNNCAKTQLINKIFNQPDSVITIINNKL